MFKPTVLCLFAIASLYISRSSTEEVAKSEACSNDLLTDAKKSIIALANIVKAKYPVVKDISFVGAVLVSLAEYQQYATDSELDCYAVLGNCEMLSKLANKTMAIAQYWKRIDNRTIDNGILGLIRTKILLEYTRLDNTQANMTCPDAPEDAANNGTLLIDPPLEAALKKYQTGE